MEKNIHYKMVVRLFTEDQDKAYGPGVAELLHRVEDLHSLRSAAMSMGMAYSKAWTIIRNGENYLGFKFLSTSTGGKGGGGAVLTPKCKELLASYDGFCKELSAYGDRLFEEKFGGFL